MRLLIILIALFLFGCVSSLEKGNNAYMKNQYREAAKHYAACGKAGNAVCINNLGYIHQKYGNTERAIEHYRLAARMGEPYAINNLKSLGEPVPVADLANKKEQNTSTSILPLLNAIISGYNKGSERNRRTLVTCDSVRTGSVETADCMAY